MLFAVVMKVIDVRPTSTSEIAKVVKVGITAEIAQATPNAAAETKTTRICGFSRRAESSAPVTDPIASTDESRPNSPAPWSNSTRAIVAVKIAKLRPNVPTMKTATMIATISGRCAT
jgi:hypothetical protein